MEKPKLYYRPECTCGRYDEVHKAAILYNLIEGISFYYEDITAEVIGCILSIERNHSFDLPWLSRKSGVKVESLAPFVQQLTQYGLLTQRILSQEEITLYREYLKTVRRQQVADNIDALHEMTVVGTASAERMYMERTGGITSVMFELTYRCR